MLNFLIPIGMKLIPNFFVDTVTDSVTGQSSTQLNWKFKLLICIFIILLIVGYVFYKNYQINSLKEEIAFKSAIISEMEVKSIASELTIESLETETKLKSNELSLKDSHIAQCYASLEEYHKDRETIDNIMDLKGDDINLDEKGEPTYERVNEPQNKAGIDFINNQLLSIE